MKKLFLLLIIPVIMFGCNTPKHINKMKVKYCRDFTSIIVKDSLIKIPVYYSDSAFLQLYLACDSNGQIIQIEKEVLQGKISTLESSLSNNRVTVHSRTIIHDTLYKTITNTIEKSGTIIYKEKPFNQWVGFRLIGFWVLLLIILFYLFYRIFKRKISGFFSAINKTDRLT